MAVNLAVKTVQIGAFDVDRVLHLTDPVFDVDVMGIEVLGVVSGRWRAEVDVSDPIPGWGVRETELRAFHESVVDASTLVWEMWTDCEVGVDSGRVGIGVFPFEWHTREGWIAEPHIVENSGVICGAGFGDGGYRAGFAARDGEVVALKIVFITPESCAAHQHGVA